MSTAFYTIITGARALKSGSGAGGDQIEEVPTAFRIIIYIIIAALFIGVIIWGVVIFKNHINTMQAEKRFASEQIAKGNYRSIEEGKLAVYNSNIGMDIIMEAEKVIIRYKGSKLLYIIAKTANDGTIIIKYDKGNTKFFPLAYSY